MSTPPHPLPRFIPTLTEVVRPPGAVVAPSPAAPTEEAILACVMHRMEALMAERFAQEWGFLGDSALSVHLKALQDQLRQELQAAARQMVSEEITRHAELYKFKS